MALMSSDLRDRQMPTLERTGGQMPKAPANAETARYEGSMIGTPCGSHMPLDIEPHWSWRNPLNILPAIILLFTLLAIIGALIS
jgi:hypothetical protein